MPNPMMDYSRFGALGRKIDKVYSSLAEWMDRVAWYQDESVLSCMRGLIPLLPRSSSVLELCCGTGRLLWELSGIYQHTTFTGIDISARMVQIASERNFVRSNVRIGGGDWIYNLPTSDLSRKFDVVIVKNALHLLDDLPQRLLDLKDVLKPTTCLIVIETISPNREANMFIRDLFSVTDFYGIKQAFFTRQSLTDALEEGGWKNDRTANDRLVRQYIDVSDWLDRKCLDTETRRRAEGIIREAGPVVRNAMGFDPEEGALPTRMLRLQFVGRFFPGVSEPVRKVVTHELLPELL